VAEYFTKEEVVKSDFLFVSYKHEDKAVVLDTVNFLLDEGIRLWYDSDLIAGNKWTTIAEGLIKHENCRGVIFFNSIPAFMSDPIYKERTFVLERLEEQNKSADTDRPFIYFPVNVGETSTMRFLKTIFPQLPEGDADTERVFPLKYIKTIVELFDSDVIYCHADEKGEYKAQLLGYISKALPTVVDKKTVIRAPGSITFGLCRAAFSTALPSYFLTKDQRADYQNVTYIVQSGHAYTTKRISWRFLYAEDDYAVLISEDVVDIRSGGKELNDWLCGDFFKTAFTEQERALVKQIGLLSENDMKKTKNPDAFIFELTSDLAETHFWISDISMGALQRVIKKNGSVYSSGYNFRTKKSGVRPVIRVHKDTLAAWI
jgi:hypothetical protein